MLKNTYRMYVVLICFILTVSNPIKAQVAKDSIQPLVKKEIKKPKKTYNSSLFAKRDSSYLHSPTHATLYSLILPGLGQAYNHKYWKIPLVYAGFGVMAYFIKTNTDLYNKFRDAYDYASGALNSTQPPTPNNAYPQTQPPPNDLVTKYPKNSLLEGREFYKRNVELSYIITVGWYLFVMLDAVVDAHFYDYNITDDISLNIKPWTPNLSSYAPYRPAAGLSLTFNFK